MNRLALTLALLGAPGLVLVALASSSDLIPAAVAPALAVIGGLAAIAGAATTRVRVHAAGVGLAIIGASLAGVDLSTPVLALGVGSATVLIASINLHLVLPADTRGFTLALTAIVTAMGLAGLALLAAQLLAWLGGGGIDAAGGLAAWLVVLTAVTWALARGMQDESEAEAQ